MVKCNVTIPSQEAQACWSVKPLAVAKLAAGLWKDFMNVACFFLQTRRQGGRRQRANLILSSVIQPASQPPPDPHSIPAANLSADSFQSYCLVRLHIQNEAGGRKDVETAQLVRLFSANGSITIVEIDTPA